MAEQAVIVELLLDGVWTDITDDVYTRDNIEITHGRADESSQPAPCSATLTLDNRDGKYNPRNPVSPLYQTIGRNTQLRIRFSSNVRFHGEVASWTPRRAVDDGDAWTIVEAAGVTRRLGQGASPLHSVLRRVLEAAPSVVAYWPCEDDDGATELASALPGAPAMQFFGDVDLASFTGFVASKPIPISNRLWGGEVPGYTDTGEIQCRFLMAIPAAGEAESIVCLVRTLGGTVGRADLVVDASGTLTLVVRDNENAVLHTMGPVAFGVNGELLRVSIELEQVGGNIDLRVSTVDDLGGGLTFGQTLNGQTLGRASAVFMNPNGIMDETPLGHISVQSEITTLFDLDRELAGWAGESAEFRILRLCLEEGIAMSFDGSNPDVGAAMGPQPVDTFLNIVREAADTDGGILYDMLDDVGLYYENLFNMVNRQLGDLLTLDFADGEVAPPLEPIVDDQATRNDITVTRTGGSSARQVLEEGPLSVQAPPDGVGRYDDAVTVNVAGDGFLANQASWRLHVGTVDDIRYPRVTVDLDANPELVTQVEQKRLGDRIIVNNLPATISPDPASMIIQGWTETIGSHRRTVTFNTSPESPYQVGVFGADARNDRYDTAGSELAPVGGGPITASVQDTFTRSVASGWGTSDTGQVWSLQGSPSSAYSVTPGLGKHTYGTTNMNLITNLSSANGGSGFDTEVLVDIAIDKAADLVSTVTAAVRSHRTSSSNNYEFRLNFGTGAGRGVQVGIRKTVASVLTTLVADTTVVGLTHAANTFIRVRAQIIGTTLRMRAWTVGDTEPASWHATVIDTSLTATAGTVSLQSVSNDDNFVMSFDNLKAGFDGETVDPDGSTTAVATTLSVTTTTGPVWTADNAEDGFDIDVGGERMTVTDIAGTSSPQTFTVTRSVNGVVKSHPAGTAVSLWQPAVFAL